MISIDTGTSDIETIQEAKNASIDTIVLDHHTPNIDTEGTEILPPAIAVVNHKRTGSKYPEQVLCGTGVAFTLIRAFLQRYGAEYNIPNGWEKWLLDRVALSTISDMVPLSGENRILVHYGLIVMGRTRNLGLQALVRGQKINNDKINEEDIAFSITPKINAASRMTHPMRAFNLLASKNQSDAQTAYNHLIELNNDRKTRVSVITRDAHKKLKNRDDMSCIVIGDPDWNVGVLGLVANKLVEENNRPVFLWSRENNIYKGSCRAPNGFNVEKLMQAAPSDTFTQYGGHDEAGGFTCELEQIHKLEDTLNTTYTESKGDIITDPVTYIDMELPIELINRELYQKIRQIAPFGVGNRKPLFFFRNIIVKSSRGFGRGDLHRELVLDNRSGGSIRVVFFFKGNDVDLLSCGPGDVAQLIGTLEEDTYRGGINIKGILLWKE